MQLTNAMKKALFQLPDSGGQERWRLKDISLNTLLALERRGMAEIVHWDGFGEGIFDRWCRTRAGREAMCQ